MHTLTFSKCTYRNVEYISIEQGGKDSEAALKATATRVKRCMQVGAPWFKAHPVRGPRRVRQSGERLVGNFRKVVEPTRDSTAGESDDWFDSDVAHSQKNRSSLEETPKVKAKKRRPGRRGRGNG